MRAAGVVWQRNKEVDMWWKKRPTRKELEEDAKEDLELKEEDAENVAGGWQPQKFKSGTETDATWK